MSSETSAHSDTYARRRVDLDALAAAFALQAGQSGAVLALAGAPVCLDLVSRPDAFARLYPKPLAGYLLDAIEHLDAPEPADAALGRFVEAAFAAECAAARPSGSARICASQERPSWALGSSWRVS